LEVGPTRCRAFFGLKGKVSMLMVLTRFSILSFNLTNDLAWPKAIAVFTIVDLVIEREGEDNHIVVLMNTMMYHHAYCLYANNKSMQFSNGFADKPKDVMFAF
jgi:hypothetical protein